MKVKEITEDYILFDNGKKITYEAFEIGTETNYAYFKHIEDKIKDIQFSEKLKFKPDNGYGFSFGSEDTPMFFVPCYSEIEKANTNYTNKIHIWYGGNLVIEDLSCVEITI